MADKPLTWYEKFKAWLKENKRPIVLGVCYVLVFIVGFGTGSFEKELKKSTTVNQKYYNTKTPSPAQNQAAGEVKGAAAGETGKPAAAPAEKPAADCAVKGNINAQGKRIYHIKGGAFYNITKPEQCFDTEKQAQDAGFVKSSR
jgi:hypothetical protein